MTKRILVTGAYGFVGNKLSAYLESQGHHVLETDTRLPGISENAKPCDITDPGALADLVEWAAPLDAVIHLAAITFVPEAHAVPDRVMDVNLNGTKNLIRAMQQKTPDARLLFISTSEVYGPPEKLPVDESHPLNPKNPYAISKAEADRYCQKIHAETGMNIVRMRPFNHSGSGQADSFVLSSFARQIAEMESGIQEPVMRVGNLEAARDFTHVDDIVRAYALALDHAESGAVYNLCSGVSRPIQSALDGLLELSGINVDIQVDPDRMRPSEVAEVRGSHDAFTEKTGWTLEKSFQTLLENLLDDWRSRLRAEGITS
jgi:GDP-4-dehydro-6-deoxy-D-mannose reductase